MKSAAFLLMLLAPAAAAARCPPGAIGIAPDQPIQPVVDAAGPGAQFCILPGVHRMQSVVPLARQRFVGLPGSILNGARVLTAFRRSGAAWVADVADPVGADAGVCTTGHEACARPAGLSLDGSSLSRTATAAGLATGSFWFDVARRQVRLAADPTGHLVEWSSARRAFSGPADDVAIEGLVVENYANAAQEGAIWPGGAGWRITGVQARHNNGVGLVAGLRGVIERCDVHHNGQLGIGSGGASDVTIRDNQVWANNTNGFDPEWEAGGIKVAASRRVVLRGNTVRGNAGPGVWCDEGCRDVVIEGNTVEANASAGIFYEISGDAVIRGNKLAGNDTAGHSWVWGAEIQVAASQGVVVTGNDITVRPGGKAIMLVDQNRARAGGGYYQTRDNSVGANRISYEGDGMAGGASDAGPEAANFGIIQAGGNRFDGDDYRVRPGAALRFIWGAGPIGLAEFRLAGQERHGTISGFTGHGDSGQHTIGR